MAEKQTIEERVALAAGRAITLSREETKTVRGWLEALQQIIAEGCPCRMCGVARAAIHKAEGQ